MHDQAFRSVYERGLKMLIDTQPLAARVAHLRAFLTAAAGINDDVDVDAITQEHTLAAIQLESAMADVDAVLVDQLEAVANLRRDHAEQLHRDEIRALAAEVRHSADVALTVPRKPAAQAHPGRLPTPSEIAASIRACARSGGTVIIQTDEPYPDLTPYEAITHDPKAIAAIADIRAQGCSVQVIPAGSFRPNRCSVIIGVASQRRTTRQGPRGQAVDAPGPLGRVRHLLLDWLRDNKSYE